MILGSNKESQLFNFANKCGKFTLLEGRDNVHKYKFDADGMTGALRPERRPVTMNKLYHR